MSNNTKSDLTINYDNLNTFVNSSNTNVDSIFNELNELYSNIDKNITSISENDNEVVSNNNEKDKDKKEKEKIIRQYISNDIKEYRQAYKESYEKAKANAKTNYTDKELERERQKQLLINEKLQQEIYANINKAKNREECIQAYQNPKEYINNNKASIAVVPREQRQMMLPQQSTNPAKSIASIAGMGFGSIQKITYASYMINMMMSLPTTLMMLGSLLFITIPTFLYNSVLGVFSTKQDMLNKRVMGKNAYGVDVVSLNNKGIAEINKLNNETTIGELDIEEKDLPNGIINTSDTIDAVKVKLDKLSKSSNEKDIENVKKLSSIINEKISEKTQEIENNSDFVNKYGIGLNMYTFQKALGYGIVILVIYFIIRFFYNLYKKSVEKKKKEEYAQANNIPVQEVTIPMLCEYSLDEKEYFTKLDIIDESVFDGMLSKFKSLSPNKILTNTSNKSFALIKGTSEVINNGLKTKTLNPVAAKFGNMIVGATNYLSIPSRGFLYSTMKRG